MLLDTHQHNWLCFNTQPPEGGWDCWRIVYILTYVSTHSRPKAAGTKPIRLELREMVSTHSRPKAAGTISSVRQPVSPVSTHSRPKAAGFKTW